MRLDTTRNGEHRVTIPAGGPLRVGTVAVVLAEVGGHLGKTRPEIERQPFGER
ncbi:MAG: hypothetical protein M0T72_10555 [Candidatus Dormibacteraeota bacterium]|nr:hypothetical protein [Candidatus Dormibacteraeota bacterium]